MESIARVYAWWPGMDGHLEHQVKECDACQRNLNKLPQSPLLPWKFPQHPCERLYADFAGLNLGQCSSFWWNHILSG